MNAPRPASLRSLLERAVIALEASAEALQGIRGDVGELRRLAEGQGRALRIPEAARVLQMREADARALLRDRGVLSHYGERPRVWAEDLRRVSDEEHARRAQQARRRQQRPETKAPPTLASLKPQ